MLYGKLNLFSRTKDERTLLYERENDFMEDLEQKMIDKINRQIKYAMSLFTNASHKRRMARIDGMVDMLTLVTGKEYVVTENGLLER